MGKDLVRRLRREIRHLNRVIKQLEKKSESNRATHIIGGITPVTQPTIEKPKSFWQKLFNKS